MDAVRAMSSVVEWVRVRDLDYPVEDLRADAFEGGWCVYAPAMLTDDDLPEDVTRSVFLVSGSGRIEEMTSEAPADEAREWFQEACIWFTAAEPTEGNPSLPSHPDFSWATRPRQAAEYDRAAIEVLGRALAQERDFGGWLGDRLGELADLLGGSSRLIARRPNSWTADHVTALAAPEDTYREPDGVWRTWPAPDPAGLPAVDTTGWLLIPCVRTCDYLDDHEAPAAGRLADVIAERAQQAPPWRACGVAELTVQLVALRRTDQLDADFAALRDFVEDGVLDQLVAPPSPDVEALLRIAIAADDREVVDLDVAATAAYRRVIDGLDLPFENYWLEALFE